MVAFLQITLVHADTVSSSFDHVNLYTNITLVCIFESALIRFLHFQLKLSFARFVAKFNVLSDIFVRLFLNLINHVVSGTYHSFVSAPHDVIDTIVDHVGTSIFVQSNHTFIFADVIHHESGNPDKLCHVVQVNALVFDRSTNPEISAETAPLPFTTYQYRYQLLFFTYEDRYMLTTVLFQSP